MDIAVEKVDTQNSGHGGTNASVRQHLNPDDNIMIFISAQLIFI